MGACKEGISELQFAQRYSAPRLRRTNAARAAASTAASRDRVSGCARGRSVRVRAKPSPWTRRADRCGAPARGPAASLSTASTSAGAVDGRGRGGRGRRKGGVCSVPLRNGAAPVIARAQGISTRPGGAGSAWWCGAHPPGPHEPPGPGAARKGPRRVPLRNVAAAAEGRRAQVLMWA